MSITAFSRTDVADYATGVFAAEPSLRHDGLTNVTLNATGGIALWGTSLAGLPRTSSVPVATLTLVVGALVTGTPTVSVRLNDGPFDTSATWTSKPGTTGSAVNASATGLDVGDAMTFDVTSAVQAAVLAGSFNGFQATADTDVTIDQTQTSLSVEWLAQSQKASALSPNGYVGVTKPLLSGFPKDTTDVRVQIDASTAGFTSASGFPSPDWSSGSQAIDAPEYDLGTSSYPGDGLLATANWTVSGKGAAGDWSLYSDPVAFVFSPLPTLTITGPSAAFPYVTDPSPTFTWQFAGQSAYQVFVTAVGDGDKTILWDTGRVTSATVKQATMPSKDSKGNLILKDRSEYRVWVKCWDGLNRVSVPGALAFAREAQVFTFQEVPGVAPVTALIVTQPEAGPILRLDIFADPPDHFAIWRDDELIDYVDPSDIDFGGGEYIYKDRTCPPNSEHTWYVERIVNGRASSHGPEETLTPVLEGLWITDVDRDLSVLLVREDLSGLVRADQATRERPLGAMVDAKRTFSKGWFQGTIEASIVADSNRTADSYYRDLATADSTPGTTVSIHYTNWAYKVLLSDLTPLPWAEAYGLNGALRVSFNVIQQNEGNLFSTPPPPGDPAMPAPDKIYTWSTFANGHALIVGDADITAIAGTPTVHASPVLHTSGEKSVTGGSWTRALPNANAFTLDTYIDLTSSLGSSSSVFTVKNPAGANPLDMRLRTGGTIDFKAFDGSVPATSTLSWKKNTWLRALLSGTWVPDASLGAGMGWFAPLAWIWVGGNVESQVYSDVLSCAPYPSLEPVNWTQLSPSDSSTNVETTRLWNYVFGGYPYGTPAVPPAIPAGTTCEVGATSDTDMWVSVYCGDALITDTIGVNRSTNSGMTGPTALSLGARGTYGFNRAHITSGLAANTQYWFQPTVNGTPTGTVATGRTQVAAGTATTLNWAGLTCQHSSPSSAAVANDVATWAGSTTLHAILHLGDDGYPDNLVGTDTNPNATGVHQFWLATAMLDPGRGILNTLGAIRKRRSDHDTNQNAVLAPKGNNPNYHDPTSYASLVTWNNVVPVPNDDARTQSVNVGGSWYTAKTGKFVIFYSDTRSQERTDVLSLPKYQAGVYDPRTDPTATMLGTGTGSQLEALKAAVDFASANSRFFILVTDPGWMGLADLDPDTNKILVSNSDKWCAYTYERDLIDTYIKTSFAGHGKTTNALIIHGDTHAVQNGVTAIGGITVLSVGQSDQNTHALATFVANYAVTYPADATANSRRRQMWTKIVLDNTSDATKVTLTATPRNCSAFETGGTPKDMSAANGYDPLLVVSRTWTL